jgi:hypothetical protein
MAKAEKRKMGNKKACQTARINLPI